MALEAKRKAAEAETMRRELIEMRARCQMYAKITGLNIGIAEPIEPEATSYDGLFSCSVTSPIAPSDPSDAQDAVETETDPALEFEVGLIDQQIEYTPIRIRQDLVSSMPDFLTSEIDFSVSDAPVFLSKLLTEVHRKR